MTIDRDSNRMPPPSSESLQNSSLPREAREENEISRLGSILARIQTDARYQANVHYGKVRRGHPEGSVINHIREVEQNIEDLTNIYFRQTGTPLEATTVLQLKILANVHDSFKATSRKGARIEDADSHASLATKFLREFVDDPKLLSSVQFHDMPYSLYRNAIKFGSVNEDRLLYLFDRVYDMRLFTLFQIADNVTNGKLPSENEGSAVEWFISESITRGQPLEGLQEMCRELQSLKRRSESSS